MSVERDEILSHTILINLSQTWCQSNLISLSCCEQEALGKVEALFLGPHCAL